MHRIVPHTPVYITEPRGTRYRVYDLVRGGVPPVLCGPGQHPEAVARWFVREGDRWTFVAMFGGDAPEDVRPALLRQQLERALCRAPRIRPGESSHDYQERQRSHIASRPDLFTEGGRLRT